MKISDQPREGGFGIREIISIFAGEYASGKSDKGLEEAQDIVNDRFP